MKILQSISIPILSFSILYGGVTGKISGKIQDENSEEPLIGANVLVIGTTLGAATDVDGFYHILNIPPGYYDLRIDMIGYAQKVIKDVRVEIDLTSQINAKMTVEALSAEMIVVQAEQKLVKTDVASSQKSISSEQISEMPVTSV